MPQPRTVVIAAFPGVELLEVTGPAEVFSVATRLAAERPSADGSPAYRVEIAAPQAGILDTAAGVRLVADRALTEVGPGVDTLLVAGAVTTGSHRAVVAPEVVDWLVTAAPGARRIGGVCAGVHLLAAAGLLDGLPATTHWLTAGQLADQHPQIAVDPDPIFIRAGRIWTCAGITAALDLALAMVAEDHGPEIALATARAMVMYVKRPGGQTQFSVPLSLQAGDDDRIDALRRWIDANLAHRISIEQMAARTHLSVRHFSRVFRQRTGRTPADYLEAVRVEAARRLLEESAHTLPEIAAASGLGSVETLHRAFRRRVGAGPAEYRRRFRHRPAV